LLSQKNRRDTTSVAMLAKCYCRAEDIFMVIENAAEPHRSPCPNLTSSPDAPNEIEHLQFCEFQPAGPATNGSVGLADGAPLQTLLDAVDDQRINLVNVLGIVHSMSAFFTDTTEDSAPEICAAFALLEQEIRCVVAGLKRASLRDRG
jgi:hypothetical protein